MSLWVNCYIIAKIYYLCITEKEVLQDLLFFEKTSDYQHIIYKNSLNTSIFLKNIRHFQKNMCRIVFHTFHTMLIIHNIS